MTTTPTTPAAAATERELPERFQAALKVEDVVTVHTKQHGTWAMAFGIVYPLTDCCKASGKGTMHGDQPVVVCRECYKPVADRFGDCANLADGPEAVWDSMARMLAGCPAGDDYARSYCAPGIVDDLLTETLGDASYR